MPWLCMATQDNRCLIKIQRSFFYFNFHKKSLRIVHEMFCSININVFFAFQMRAQLPVLDTRMDQVLGCLTYFAQSGLSLSRADYPPKVADQKGEVIMRDPMWSCQAKSLDTNARKIFTWWVNAMLNFTFSLLHGQAQFSLSTFNIGIKIRVEKNNNDDKNYCVVSNL